MQKFSISLQFISYHIAQNCLVQPTLQNIKINLLEKIYSLQLCNATKTIVNTNLQYRFKIFLNANYCSLVCYELLQFLFNFFYFKVNGSFCSKLLSLKLLYQWCKKAPTTSYNHRFNNCKSKESRSVLSAAHKRN